METVGVIFGDLVAIEGLPSGNLAWWLEDTRANRERAQRIHRSPDPEVRVTLFKPEDWSRPELLVDLIETIILHHADWRTLELRGLAAQEVQALIAAKPVGFDVEYGGGNGIIKVQRHG